MPLRVDVLNDTISIYFADATLASAFVARWCVGSQVEAAGGVVGAANNNAQQPGSLQAWAMGYFAKISSTRLKAFSAAAWEMNDAASHHFGNNGVVGLWALQGMYQPARREIGSDRNTGRGKRQLAR